MWQDYLQICIKALWFKGTKTLGCEEASGHLCSTDKAFTVESETRHLYLKVWESPVCEGEKNPQV